MSSMKKETEFLLKFYTADGVNCAQDAYEYLVDDLYRCEGDLLGYIEHIFADEDLTHLDAETLQEEAERMKDEMPVRFELGNSYHADYFCGFDTIRQRLGYLQDLEDCASGDKEDVDYFIKNYPVTVPTEHVNNVRAIVHQCAKKIVDGEEFSLEEMQ